MATYVCTSNVCEWRDRCELHKPAVPQYAAGAVIFFCPPEERGVCPHRILKEPQREHS